MTPDERGVASCGGAFRNTEDTTDENEANARFIVKAANLHERLVAALDSAIKTANFEGHPFRPWHNDARAILAEAKEGK